MTADALTARLAAHWQAALPVLADYIRIPALSPNFDADWATHGHLAEAAALLARWARLQPVPGLTVEVLEHPERTPLLIAEAPGTGAGTVLVYGHLDKQPELTGWREGLGPWQPVLDDGRLYGRGGADDGYAMVAAIGALAALAAESVPHARCLCLIEASEESGSPDLPAWLDALAPRIGDPDLVVALDSGCGDYERLWVTTSLRGLVGGTLEVAVLSEGVHSGDAGGVVPDSFRIARALVERLEDAATGRIRLPALAVEPPPERRREAEAAAAVLGDALWRRFPLLPGVRPQHAEAAALVLARTWEPALAVIGAGGLPPSEAAGNVLRPATALDLSLRLPPTVPAGEALAAVTEALSRDPPHGADVRFTAHWLADGWHARPFAPWVTRALEAGSRAAFGRPPMAMGEGGTIPFVPMLARRFPAAELVVTGVLGPQANAHGPNEFLHLGAALGVSSALAHLLAAHARFRADEAAAAQPG